MKIIFRIQRTDVGWIVVDGKAFGPFAVKQQAVDLAKGMADVIRQHGGEADVVIDDGA